MLRYCDALCRRQLFILLAMMLFAGDISAQTSSIPLRIDHSLSPGISATRSSGQNKLPDTVKILAVMVEFKEDSDTRTSGTGKFGTIFPYDYGAEIIDPLPHDRSYFQAHLRFLENYIRKASGGRTNAVSEILDGPITVSKQIKDYSYRKNESEKPVADLAVEAWTIADSQFPNIDFSYYNMFIVFHAGRGRDIDLASIQGVDPTPFDIPSLSFTLNSFRRFHGVEYKGIPVRNGSFHISNSSIIPTTNSREIPLLTGETGLLELSINGLLAASFGTYADLPDLFNTKSGTTGIGRFGLMDGEAIFAYGGICPPEPSAWEKIFLGWASPREAAAGKRQYLMTAHRSDQPSTPDVLKVPITGKEYWLLENRHRDPAGNGQRITMISGGQEFELRFPKDTTGFDNGNISALKGVVVDVEDLDWSLPGGMVIGDNNTQVRVNAGILIWHIDENIIDVHLAGNTVNADPDRRGVDLEQAGGPQDIGKQIPSIFGTTTGTGSPLDFWFKGNISPVYSNSFGAMTMPNSRSNSGAFTHVTIDNFSSQSPIMSVDIELGDNTIAPMTGFPIDLLNALKEGQNNLLIQTADIDSDGMHEIFVAASYPDGFIRTDGKQDTSYVFGVRQDGSKVISSAHSHPLVAALPGVQKILIPPMIADIDEDAILEIIIVGENPATGISIAIFQTRDDNSDGSFDLDRIIVESALNIENVRQGSFIVQNMKLMYGIPGLAVDTLVVVAKDIQRIPVPHPTSSISGEGGFLSHLVSPGEGDALMSFGQTASFVDIAGAQSYLLSGYSLSTGSPDQFRIRNAVAADFDGDGAIEGAGFTSTGLGVFSLPGDTKTPDIPARVKSSLDFRSKNPVLSAADVDGDGRYDLVIADSSRLMVYNHALAFVDYYPISLGARYALAVRFDDDNHDAIFSAGNDELFQLHTKARYADGFPIPIPENASVVLFPVGATNQTLGIALAGSDGRLCLYNTPNTVNPNSFTWRSIFADERNSNYSKLKGQSPISPAEFFPQARCYNWPNPTYESTTKLRYFVSQDADIVVTIYDYAGEKVDEINAKAIGGTDNEIEWNVSKIQSGVYLAHVKATSGALSGTKIVKVAVVR